jgi:protein-disulfide isomerase
MHTQQRLAALILAMPPERRDVVLLRYYEGLNSGEIARRLGTPEGTIRWRLKAAISELRQELEGPESRRALLPLSVWATSVAAVVVVGVSAFATRTADVRKASADPVERRASADFQPGVAVAPLIATSPPSLKLPRPAAVSQNAAEYFNVPLGTGPLRGPGDARVTLLLFIDYECPFCARMVATIDALVAKYPNDLRVQVIHAPLPFHGGASLAAKAVIAAGEQGKFWEMHDRVLADNASGIGRDRLTAHARDIGLDTSRFSADLDGAAVAQKLESDLAAQASAGVDGTPTTFINGRRINGAQPIEVFERAIEEGLRRADEALAAGVPRDDLYTELVKSFPAVVPPRPRHAVPQDLPTATAKRDAIVRCFKDADELKLIDGAAFWDGDWVTIQNPGPQGRAIAKCVSQILGQDRLRFRTAYFRNP